MCQSPGSVQTSGLVDPEASEALPTILRPASRPLAITTQGLKSPEAVTAQWQHQAKDQTLGQG